MGRGGDAVDHGGGVFGAVDGERDGAFCASRADGCGERGLLADPHGVGVHGECGLGLFDLDVDGLRVGAGGVPLVVGGDERGGDGGLAGGVEGELGRGGAVRQGDGVGLAADGELDLSLGVGRGDARGGDDGVASDDLRGVEGEVGLGGLGLDLRRPGGGAGRVANRIGRGERRFDGEVALFGERVGRDGQAVLHLHGILRAIDGERHGAGYVGRGDGGGERGLFADPGDRRRDVEIGVSSDVADGDGLRVRTGGVTLIVGRDELRVHCRAAEVGERQLRGRGAADDRDRLGLVPYGEHDISRCIGRGDIGGGADGVSGDDFNVAEVEVRLGCLALDGNRPTA